MITNNALIVIVVASLLVMLIGFGFRDHNGGLVFAGIGLLFALAAVIYKGIETFG